MTSKESALLAQMQDLGYSQGMIVTAMRILGQSKAAQDVYNNRKVYQIIIEK